MKRVWILISWLYQKPADQDLHSFHQDDKSQPTDQDLLCVLSIFLMLLVQSLIIILLCFGIFSKLTIVNVAETVVTVTACQ